MEIVAGLLRHPSPISINGSEAYETFLYVFKPHLVDIFWLSSDPSYIENVRDIVGPNLIPPEGAVVLRVDEKVPQTGGRNKRSYLGENLWLTTLRFNELLLRT
jgi:hypothetical protein